MISCWQGGSAHLASINQHSTGWDPPSRTGRSKWHSEDSCPSSWSWSTVFHKVPCLVLFYPSKLLDITKKGDIKVHSYADDTQVHLSTGASNARTAVWRFVSCTEKIESWMSCNRLKMNAEKTKVIWIGSRQQLAKVDIEELHLLSANVHFSTTVSKLGVHFNSQLTMRDQVTAACRWCFFQLRQLRTIRNSLTADAATTLAQAFVVARLDYCNSLLYGVSEDVLRCLRRVQNAAARFFTGARKYDHISPVLRDLYWLPLLQKDNLVDARPKTVAICNNRTGQLYIPRTKKVTFKNHHSCTVVQQ